MINFCESCFEKQRKIDTLEDEVSRLRAKLGYLERTGKEGYFGSSTPSSEVPFKKNSLEENQNKKGGAKEGHCGHGRKTFNESEADRVVEVETEVGDRCPHCGRPLEDKGAESRCVIEIPPMKAQKIVYKLHKRYCPHCHRVWKANAPGVLPRNLYGNQLIATSACMHYQYGIPIGRLCEQFGIGNGSLIKTFYRVEKMFTRIQNTLIEQYRESPVKHADETGWRNDGHSGYAWLFATQKISIFLFRETRSASVTGEVFGMKALPGTLVVDRYNGYNKAPCAIQYCYAHLLREVQDLEKDFPDNKEVQSFVVAMAPLLSAAMSLRGLPISDDEFYKQAAQLKSDILQVVQSHAVNLGIRRIQEIFHEKQTRLYHWASDRRIPADNNLAERDLRPTVIARKVSFGSQSNAGAQTRSVLMTVLHTLKKRNSDPCAVFKTAIDKLAQDSTLDPFKLLFSDNST